jgi:hypothetical protein
MELVLRQLGDVSTALNVYIGQDVPESFMPLAK